METGNRVNRFLARFHESNNVDTVFTNGCCYWFAMILFIRFINEYAAIMYDQTVNHFGTMIDGRIYDITGDVTDKYNWKPWSELDDELLRKRIIRDCIDF